MGYKGGYTEARRWNREAYGQYQAERGESRQRFDENVAEAIALRERTLADYDKMTDQEKVDFQRAMDAALANEQARMAQRGIYNSSIANTAAMGNRRETAYGLNRLADERLRGRLGYDIGLTSDLINLKQAGPTAPSTAFFQATTSNLQAAMNYKLASQAWDASQRGPNQSWSAELSRFYSPQMVRTRAEQAAGIAVGALTGSGGANSFYSGPTNGQGGYGGYQFGSQTAAMTQPSQQQSSRPTYNQYGQNQSGVFRENRRPLS